jgi:5-methylcytosine-specific restriction endonuclease McrA
MKRRPPKLDLAALRDLAYKRQRGLCYWCGQEMIYHGRGELPRPWNHPRTLTADHLIRKADGGRTTSTNIVAACAQCNNRRHDPSTKRHDNSERAK